MEKSRSPSPRLRLSPERYVRLTQHTTEFDSMKTIILFFSLFYFGFIYKNQNTLIEKFTIGKYNFSIYKEGKFLHDDNLNAEFFVVYAKNKKQSLCSSHLKLSRNDTVIKTGKYIHDKNKLVFKEYNFYVSVNQSDSLIKTFIPDNRGNLKLTEVLNFKNGKVKKTNY